MVDGVRDGGAARRSGGRRPWPRQPITWDCRASCPSAIPALLLKSCVAAAQLYACDEHVVLGAGGAHNFKQADEDLQPGGCIHP